MNLISKYFMKPTIPVLQISGIIDVA